MQMLARAEAVNKSHGPFDVLLCLDCPVDLQSQDLLTDYVDGKKESKKSAQGFIFCQRKIKIDHKKMAKQAGSDCCRITYEL